MRRSRASRKSKVVGKKIKLRQDWIFADFFNRCLFRWNLGLPLRRRSADGRNVPYVKGLPAHQGTRVRRQAFFRQGEWVRPAPYHYYYYYYYSKLWPYLSYSCSLCSCHIVVMYIGERQTEDVTSWLQWTRRRWRHRVSRGIGIKQHIDRVGFDLHEDYGRRIESTCHGVA